MIPKSKTFPFLVLPFLVLGLFCVACGRDQVTQPPAEAPAGQESAAKSPAFEIEPEKFQIRDAANEVMGFVNIDGEVIRVVLPAGDQRRLAQTRLSRKTHHYNERGVGPVALVDVDMRSFVENLVMRSPSGEFRYRVELRADRALIFDRDVERDDPEAEPFLIRRTSENFLRVNYRGESLGSVLINDKNQVRVRNGADELVYKLNSVDHFTTAFGILLLPEAEPLDRLILLAELHLLERLVSSGAK